MSNRDIERLKNELLTNKIELSDTISQFMEKCNNNFSAIIEWGGGPAGEKGDEGEPGIPTKPKVPIHIWRKGIEYDSETIDNDTFTICYSVDLTDSKYQEGHLIMLKNAHVYILETNSEFKLTPKYIFTLQSYDPSTTINGENAYMHIAYANSPDGDGFVTDQELRNENVEVEPAMTYNLRRDVNSNNSSTNKIYMGVYSDNDPTPSQNPSSYTWVKIQGDAGAKGADGQKGDKGDKGDPGEQGPKGDKGDGYTGQPYTIDLEGDMSTISIDVDRTRLYDDSNDYCMCKLHAYYGDQNVLLDVSNVTVNLPEEFEYSDDNCVDIVLKSDLSSKVGKIEKSQNGKDVIIKFTPDVSFVFPTNPIIFSLHIESEITDDDESKYNFTRDTVWMVKGIVSTFELEIIPKHRSIKLSEDGTYNPEKLLVDVYKNEDGKRTLFDFNQYESFTLLYKNYNDNDWIEYPNEGVETSGVSCLEFKVVRYLGTLDEETWDYEDVWVVADGKSTHYYHADLGAMESMMVLTTGERINISENTDTPIYCAKLRDESGYSITFEPKLYDGETELTVQSISVGSNSGEEYYTNGSFERKIEEYTLTITKVPYDVEMIPMNIIVSGVDSFGVTKQDTVSFIIYISNLSNIYTLSPTVSVYNTSTGTDGVDKIGCNVYKNNILVETDELNTYALTLEYIVCGEQGNTNKKNYTKPIVYGYDTSGNNDDFTASDVAIEFILSYRNKEIAMATVPLIKDGQNGKDGEDGKDGAHSKVMMIYTSNDGTTPDTPTGGSYNFTDGSFECPTGWNTNDTNLSGIVWVSSTVFESNGNQEEQKWSSPVRLTGADGQAGKDGADIDFAYCSTSTTTNIYPPIDMEEDSDSDNTYYDEFGHYTGGYEYTNEENNITYKWTNNPSGVDETNRYEFMTMRTKIDGEWSSWSTPTLWSNYGVNGQDGDGVEYVYTTTNSENDTPTISIPDDWSDVSSDYQKSEFKPTNDEGESIWSDNPSGVKDEEGCRVEWVSSRKYCVSQNDDIKKWQKFSEPKVWSRFSKDGEDGKDGNSWQYIFCVSPKYPFSETGFSNPSEWTDDKPEDSNNELLGDNGQKDPKWFDEHKDVDAVNKFQYQAYRKWDRDNGCWGKYGYPTLYSNYSESGSGYSVMLSNPIAVIPVGDDDWSTNENASNQTDSTFVYFYNNTSDMSTSENLTISLPQDNIYVTNGNFTTERENGVNKVVFKPVVSNSVFNFGSNSQYKLPIILTYDLGNSDGDKFTTTINWTLSPIKGLSDVEVYVDKRIVNISENTTQSIKVGYYLKSSDGTKTFVEDKTSDNNKGYKIFLTDDIEELNDENEVNDWTNAVYTFVYDDGSNKNCYVVLTDSNGNKLDYVNVTSIKDGENGKDGQSTIYLELSQDYISLPGDGFGDIHPSYTEDTIVKASLYEGHILIEGTYTIVIKNNNGSTITRNIEISKENIITFKKDFFKGLIDSNYKELVCEVTFKGVTRRKTITIDLVETPYELEIDKYVLTRDGNSGNILEPNINVKVKYWKNGSWVYTINGLVRIKVGDNILNNEDLYIINYDTHTYTHTIDNLFLQDTTEFKIVYIENNKELTYESLGIISNGEKGEKGEPGESKVGKIPYPAGKYDTSKVYTSTDVKSPYVVDSNGDYYVLKETVYWKNGFCYYNATAANNYPQTYHYVSIAPDEYDKTLATGASATGCTESNYSSKITTPSVSTVKTALGTTKKYYTISYKYYGTNNIIGNSIWKLDENDNVVMISKFRYSTDGSAKNIVNGLYNSSSLETPSDNISSSATIGSKVWEKFESFEALYAKIAMIDNGTIGSAVYSGDFMFSKQGVDGSGNTSPDYQNFDKNNIYNSSSQFKPNICINFNTGQMWAAGGNIEMASNGNINMNGNITIGGDLKLNGFFKRIKTEITSSNYNNYTTTTNGLTYIDIKKCGTYIHVKSLPSGVTQINLPYHKLPYNNTNTIPPLTIDRNGIELMRQIYGIEIIIINDTTKNLNIGCRGAMDGGTLPSGTLPLNKGCMEIYKLGFQIFYIDGKNIESYCWSSTSSGTISGGIMENNTNASNVILPTYPNLDTDK